jgi:hypothetical protein
MISAARLTRRGSLRDSISLTYSSMARCSSRVTPTATASGVYSYSPIVDRFENRVAVYPIYCAVKISEPGACADNGERAANVTRYIAHIDQQDVVGVTENAPAPEKLFNCIVADVKNWVCTLEPAKDSTHAIMRKGIFSNDPPASPGLPEFRYTSRWNYLRVKYLAT